MKVVVLEDWNEFFQGVPSVTRLRERAEVVVQSDHPVDQADLVARLQDVQIAVLMRERTPFGAGVIDALPSLELIAQTGAVGSNIAVAAATARGVAVTSGSGQGNPLETLSAAA